MGRMDAAAAQDSHWILFYTYNARGEHKRAAAGERGDKESFYEVNQESNKKIPARQLIYMWLLII